MNVRRLPSNHGQPSRGMTSFWPVGPLATSTQIYSGWISRIKKSFLMCPIWRSAPTPSPVLFTCVKCPKTALQAISARHTSSTEGRNLRSLNLVLMVSKRIEEHYLRGHCQNKTNTENVFFCLFVFIFFLWCSKKTPLAESKSYKSGCEQ